MQFIRVSRDLQRKRVGAPVALGVKRLPTDLNGDGHIIKSKRISIAHRFSLLALHRSDIAEMLLKKT